MSQKYTTCVFLLQLIVIFASSEEEFRVLKIEDENYTVHEKPCPVENNIRSYIKELKTFVENKFETLQTNIEDTINQKLHKLERKIREIDIKIDEIDIKILENMNNEIDQKLKNISEIEDSFNSKFDYFTINFQDLKNATLENGIKLEILGNTTIDNSNMLKTIKNSAFNNTITLKDTLSQAILQAHSVTNKNCELYESMQSTLFNMSSTLQQVMNMTNATNSMLNKLNNAANNNAHLKSELQNITFNNINKTSVINNTKIDVLPKAESCSTKKTLNETHQINWLECKEEKINSSQNVWNQTLHSIDQVTVKQVSECVTKGNSTDFPLHIGVLGNGTAHIILSREPVTTRSGLYFVIEISKFEAKLYSLVKDGFVVTRNVETNFSYTQATGLSITRTHLNETLEVRLNNSSTALIEYHDPLISQLKYFGFEYMPNSRDYITYLYDC